VLLITVDQCDLMTFHGKAFTKKVADLAGSNDEYVHL
jgi:hypothetical protein